MSRLDSVYRRLLLTQFFTQGWGHPDHMKAIMKLRRQFSRRDFVHQFLTRHRLLDPSATPITLTRHDASHADYDVLEGHFTTPCQRFIPQLLPPECRHAHFQALLPKRAHPHYAPLKPLCVQFAGTGDHYFWRRRRLMGLPLLKERGVASVIVENPFYGLRKPRQQVRSSLRNVTDMFVMGACLMLESLVIYQWAQSQGYGPLVWHGISMGGHMAALGATVLPTPVGVVPCLALTSASPTFTKGVLSEAIPWPLLERQYATLNAYREEIVELMRSDWTVFQAGVDYMQQEIASPSADFMNAAAAAAEPSPSAPPDHSSSLLEALKLPSLFSGHPSSSLSDKSRREVMQFMRGIMDECTHLKNFAVPLDPSMSIVVSAEHDAYQPREDLEAIPDIWPGAQIRYIPGGGHISSYLFSQHVFRQAIYDSVDMLIEKYHAGRQ